MFSLTLEVSSSQIVLVTCRYPSSEKVTVPCCRYDKERCFLRGFQDSPVFISGKSSMWMKMCMEHWWNDRKNRSTLRETCQWHFVHHKSQAECPGDRTRAFKLRSRRLNSWAMAWNFKPEIYQNTFKTLFPTSWKHSISITKTCPLTSWQIITVCCKKDTKSHVHWVVKKQGVVMFKQVVHIITTPL